MRKESNEKKDDEKKRGNEVTADISFSGQRKRENTTETSRIDCIGYQIWFMAIKIHKPIQRNFRNQRKILLVNEYLLTWSLLNVTLESEMKALEV